MGDLVHSERTDSVARLHRAFNTAVKRVNSSHAKDIVSPLTITLGDEFQGLTRNLESGVGLVQNLRRGLKDAHIECRFVIGLVKVQTPVNQANAWNMMGPGLARARDKLSDKRHPNAYRFSLPKDATREVLLDAIGYSLTEIESAWTDRQREVALFALDHGRSGAENAAALKLAPRTYYKIRQAARAEFYENQWRALKLGVVELDVRYKLLK